MSDDLSDLVQQVRDHVPVDLAAEWMDLPVRQGKTWAPDREETEPSVQLYPDHWYDYGSGRGGDVISFVRAYAGLSFPKAVLFLAGKAEELELNVRVRVPEREVKDFYHELVSHPPALHQVEVAAKFEKRYGFPPLGGLYAQGTDCLLVPHWHVARVVGVKVRNLTTGEKWAWPGSSFTEGLYWQARLGFSTLVITEGESDAWTAVRLWKDCDVASLPSGAGNVQEKWFKPLLEGRAYATYLLCMDHDDAGERARLELRKVLRATDVNRPHTIGDVKFPAEHKDLNEAYRAGWRP